MKAQAASGDLAAPLALDAGALTALRLQAKTSPKAALTAAATQFEALFVQMLLKSMRDALPQDGIMSSETSKTYTSMFDQQIAQQMSKKGIGLRQMLERQLAPALGTADDATGTNAVPATATRGGAAAPAGPPSATIQSGAMHAHVRGGASSSSHLPSPARTKSSHEAIDGAAATGDASEALGAATTGERASRMPANVRAFIEKMRPHAEAAAKVVGVPADLLLAQAGLETGWGRSQPRTATGDASHNLFGIKAGRAWSGAVAVASTTEYVAGALVRTVDRFRSYGSYTEAFQDFGRLLAGNGRYAGAVAKSDDPVAYAKSLQRGGYATDPHYADKLVRAIRLVSGDAAVARAAPAQVMVANAVNRKDEAAS
jgi:flagellar protein FlgJ